MATYVFVFDGSLDWRKSTDENWNLDLMELDGTEKLLGHRKICDAICKVLQTSEGRVIAVQT